MPEPTADLRPYSTHEEVDVRIEAERQRISRFVEDWLQLGPRADTTYRHTETYGELVRRIRTGDY